jgi:hypothetical protein
VIHHATICRAVALAVGLGLAICPASAAGPQAAWLAGPALHKELARPVDVFWTGTPLRQAIMTVAEARRVAVVFDRRVDPDQKLDLTVSDVPLEDLFHRVAESRELGVTMLDAVTYFGPTGATSRLRTLAAMRRDDARRLPAAASRKMLQPERFHWSDLATPRELLSQLAARGDLKLYGLEQVPHDLWAAADLPPMALVDRLTLVALQFDLTFQLDPAGDSLTLVPIPEKLGVIREYPAGRDPEQALAKLRAVLPNAQVRVDGDKILVRALVEEHERLTSAPRPPVATRPKPATVRGEKRYTVKIAELPLEKILQSLATKLGLELKIDTAAFQRAGVSLDQPVSFNVKEATVDQLFHAVLDPAGCTFRRQGGTITVRPAGSSSGG